MIYFFYGNDAVRAKVKIKKLTNVLLTKKPEALHFYFDDRSFDNEFVKSLFQSAGLFAEHHVIFLDRTFSVFETNDLVEGMKESPHVFILFEDSLNKKDLDYIKKYTEKFEEYETKKIEKKDSRSSIFSLTDALQARDKKRLWALYREFVGDGMSPEEIQPMLFWQVKTMLAVRQAKNAKDAGVKPFVYTKTKRYADLYSRDDLCDLSRSLVQALYDSRQGRDLENELERVLLSL